VSNESMGGMRAITLRTYKKTKKQQFRFYRTIKPDSLVDFFFLCVNTTHTTRAERRAEESHRRPRRRRVARRPVLYEPVYKKRKAGLRQQDCQREKWVSGLRVYP